MSAETGVWAVVVARVANGAKSRLSPALDATQRRELALAMLADVLHVCAQARATLDGVVAVVDDPLRPSTRQNAAGARRRGRPYAWRYECRCRART